jgi:Na+-transporting NADH:ubiquinone oxidoreductase subunit C
MSNDRTNVNVFKERIFPVLFMLIITIFFIAIVSGIYLATRETVLRNEALYLKQAVLYAADISVPSGAEEIENLYFEKIREVNDEDGNTQYYEVNNTSGQAAGYVVPAEGPGLWGEIQAVVGFSKDLATLTGIDFIKQNETPGLGARISESWFREQFRGKSGPFQFVPEGTETKDDREFDAITGATITSTAVRNILNEIKETVPQIIK